MKGKNKDINNTSTSQYNSSSLGGASSASPSLSNHHNQLSYPDITPIDSEKQCPRFTSILNRAEGVGVGIEEMDSLQMEIERMLVNVIQRNRALTIENMILDSDRSDGPSLLLNGGGTLNKSLSTPQTPNEKHLAKMKKAMSGKPLNTSAVATAAGLATSLIKTNSLLAAEVTQPIVRNDIPDTFWQSVEPYCSDITEDDIRMLEDQIDDCDKFMHINKIGPIGKHYSIQWNEEDLGQQMKEGTRFSDFDQTAKSTLAQKRKLNESTASRKSALASTLLDQSFEKIGGGAKKHHHHNHHHNQAASSNFSYGPLTQRLISALIEQNLMSPFDNEITDYLDRISPPESSYISPRTMAKKCFTFGAPSTSSSSSAAVTNSASGGGGMSHIEKKIKKTLIEQGILDLDEDKSTAVNDSELAENAIGKDDEIGNEILNVQKELKMVAQQTKQTLLHLVELSKQNLVKQEIRKKISALDNEIIETFEKFQNARFSKLSLSKKEKEKALKLIRDRETLQNQLKVNKCIK